MWLAAALGIHRQSIFPFPVHGCALWAPNCCLCCTGQQTLSSAQPAGTGAPVAPAHRHRGDAPCHCATLWHTTSWNLHQKQHDKIKLNYHSRMHLAGALICFLGYWSRLVFTSTAHNGTNVLLMSQQSTPHCVLMLQCKMPAKETVM